VTSALTADNINAALTTQSLTAATIVDAPTVSEITVEDTTTPTGAGSALTSSASVSLLACLLVTARAMVSGLQ